MDRDIQKSGSRRNSDGSELVEKVVRRDYRGNEGVGYLLPTATSPRKVKLNQGSLVRVLCGDPGSSGNLIGSRLIAEISRRQRRPLSLLQ